MTRYFGAGVFAATWTTDTQPRWKVGLRRDEGSLQFLDLDGLKRRIHQCVSDFSDVNAKPRLMKERVEYPEDEIAFASVEAARECVLEIEKAVRHIQAVGSDDSWLDLSMAVFDNAHLEQAVQA